MIFDVAAGTCACGRAIAPYAKSVVCLDMMSVMLSIGKAEAQKVKLDNMVFLLGDAAELPFLESSFDLVLSRLAFHHFSDIKQPFAEMVRVLKPGSRLVLIDMEALRETRDQIERMRDPSHVRNLSRAEMLSLYRESGLTVSCCETVRIPMILQSWLEHTKTPSDIQTHIVSQMKSELSGNKKTGFMPYDNGNKSCLIKNGC